MFVYILRAVYVYSFVDVCVFVSVCASWMDVKGKCYDFYIIQQQSQRYYAPASSHCLSFSIRRRPRRRHRLPYWHFFLTCKLLHVTSFHESFQLDVITEFFEKKGSYLHPQLASSASSYSYTSPTFFLPGYPSETRKNEFILHNATKRLTIIYTHAYLLCSFLL